MSGITSGTSGIEVNEVINRAGAAGQAYLQDAEQAAARAAVRAPQAQASAAAAQADAALVTPWDWTAPTTGPRFRWSLDLQFIRDAIDPRFQQAGGNGKSYWTPGGLTVAQPSAWPIEWDPVGGLKLGRSVWGEARTNAVTHNRNLGARVGNLVDFVQSESGRWRMRETTAEGAHYLPQSFSIAAGQWACASGIVAKASEGGERHAVIVFTGSAMAMNYGVQLNLETGALTFSSPAVAAAMRTWVLQLPDGTWFLGAAAQAASSALVSVQFRIGNTPSISFNAYAGDGVSGVDWDWLQAEIGDRPSPPIVTGATAVTRPAETGRIPLGEGVFNPREGCVVAEFTPYGPRTQSGFTLCLLAENSPAENYLGLGYQVGTLGAGSVYWVNGGSGRVDSSFQPLPYNVPGTLAFAWSGRDYAIAMNGQIRSQGTSATDMADMKTLSLSRRLGVNDFPSNSLFRRVRLATQRPTNAQLQEVSAGLS